MQDNTKYYIRGGQITLHNFRMLMQISNRVMLAVAIVFVLTTGGAFWMKLTPYEKYFIPHYAWSTVIPLLNEEARLDFIQPNGRRSTIKYTAFRDSFVSRQILHTLARKLMVSVIDGLVALVLSAMVIVGWLRKRGEMQTRNELVKGDRILTPAETKKLIIGQKLNSDLLLAGLPLIRGSETTHMLFHGTVGTGKSNAIKELMDQIRARGDSAIIYDKSCNLLEEFYRSNDDILLNPLDTRGEAWDLWAECRDSADFDSLAAALIPMQSTQDPFWINAARTIFASAAWQMRNDPDRSISRLLQILLSSDLESIQAFLRGTESETLVSEKIEKTAISIKSVLATYLKSLKYVREGEKPFSIRKWVHGEQGKHCKKWLFVTSLGDRHETLKPLITAWLDIAVNSVMSLASNMNRRIWLVLDELPSLQRLPYLTGMLSESRKFGGCVVIGIQNYAQLASLYGPDGARAISSLLNTRFMFRQPDPEMARWAASNFGETVVSEVREGNSYGANSMQDGISINRVETRKSLVSYSEIIALANLHAYVRLPGDFPVTLVEFVYQARKRKNTGFLQRELEEGRIGSAEDSLPVTKREKKTGRKKKKSAKTQKENAVIAVPEIEEAI